MAIHLDPIDNSAFPVWMERCTREYVADLVWMGASEEDAQRKAAESIQGAFPQGRFPEGRPTAENAVFELKDESDESVGTLWVGRDQSNDPTAWWVWDIVIEPEYRRRGYGRAAMLLAEEYARSMGAVTLGLNVFGFNETARALYESLGYETTRINMRKRLTAE